MVVNKYKNGEYTIMSVKGSNSDHTPNLVFNVKYIYTYSINYVIWIYDGNNELTRSIFDFIVVPKNIEPFDFTNYSFEEFFEFMNAIKN